MTASDNTVSRSTFLRRSLAVGAGLTLGVDLGHSLPAGATESARAGGRTATINAKALRTLRDRVAQLFVVSFTGTTASYELLSLLDRYPIGGLILYAPNCHTSKQVQSLLAELQAAARFPLLICTDQEGGKVVRIRNGVPAFPAESVYGRLDVPAHVYHDAARTAKDLRALGLTMNLAPVVDVLSNPRSPIGKRSYGANPHVAAQLSVSAINAYQRHGLAATAKHFMGLGHASIDSHHLLPTVPLTLAQFEADDLIPFRAAVAAGVSSVLVAHVALSGIDPVRRPASLSPVIITGILRGHLGFKGLIMTDSLLMGALPKGHEAEAAERAFAAGADILLLGGNSYVPPAMIEEAIERVTAAVASGRVPESRLEDALGQVLALKRRYAPVSPSIG